MALRQNMDGVFQAYRKISNNTLILTLTSTPTIKEFPEMDCSIQYDPFLSSKEGSADKS